MPGTLSFDAARWGHPRAGAILLSPDWSDDKNELGWPGMSTSTVSPATARAAAGTFTPPDRRRSGPAKEAVSHWPSANVDLAPTLCRLAGIDVPASMQGRVSRRRSPARRTKPHREPDLDVVRVENQVGAIRYSLSGHFSEVAG